MEDNGDIAMPSIDRHEVAWLSVDVAICDEKGGVAMKLRFRMRRHPKTPWRG
jgi:hypothetical protein